KGLSLGDHAILELQCCVPQRVVEGPEDVFVVWLVVQGQSLGDDGPLGTPGHGRDGTWREPHDLFEGQGVDLLTHRADGEQGAVDVPQDETMCQRSHRLHRRTRRRAPDRDRSYAETAR